LAEISFATNAAVIALSFVVVQVLTTFGVAACVDGTGVVVVTTLRRTTDTVTFGVTTVILGTLVPVITGLAFAFVIPV
tara:strand:- start:142 stop:375 length:234 start_codon:yes stop_codon:yes gene_type:complete